MMVPSRDSSPALDRAAVAWVVAAATGLCVCAGGCGTIDRRLTINSNPPGAQVYVDDYEIGTTPVSTNFIYYGTRKIRLVKEGYETLTVMQNIPSPWYEIPPLDFVSENLVPGKIRDQRALNYTMTPQLVVPPEQLLARAESLRRGVHTAAGDPTRPGAAATRVNPAAPGSGRPPAPTGATPDIGGQPVYPLPPR